MARVIIAQSIVIEAEFDDDVVESEELRQILSNLFTTKMSADMKKNGSKVITCRCDIRLKDEKPTVN